MTSEPTSNAATSDTRIEQIRRRHAAPTSGPWDTSRGTISGYIEQARDDIHFLLEQYDAVVKILAEAEKVVPGLIVTSGRMALDG
jgi:hypothetical protein